MSASHPIPLAIALALCAAGLGAQSLTSPRGLDSYEGDASHFALFNPGYARFQQIDDTQRSHPATLRSIGFRRDFERTAPLGGPRTLSLLVRLGEADYLSATGTFATNWSAAPTVAFAARPVNTPDWSGIPTARPMPFELTLGLDAPFVYSGNQALAFELEMTNVSAAGSPEVDAERGTTLIGNTAVGASIGFGCIAGGRPIEMGHSLFLENRGPTHPGFGMRIGSSIAEATPNQGVLLNIDFVDQALAVPGLCTTLYALPTINFALGVSDAVGSVPLTWIALPYVANLEGVHFYTQALALAPGHAGIPVVLSDRRDARMPDAPRAPPACGYVYATSLATPSGTLWRDRGVVVRFGT